VAERGAGGGGERQHGGDAGNDLQLDRTPGFGTGLHRLAHGGGHGEDAGIAAGHHRGVAVRDCMIERGTGAGQLLAIVGGDGGLVGTQIEPGEIGAVAEQGFRGSQRFARGLGEVEAVARSEPDDAEHRRHVSRPAQPGTRTMEK
jgi:hypothetical protein